MGVRAAARPPVQGCEVGGGGWGTPTPLRRRPARARVGACRLLVLVDRCGGLGRPWPSLLHRHLADESWMGFWP